MKRNKIFFKSLVALSLACASLIGSSAFAKTEAAQKKNATWQNKMDDLAQALSQIIPNLFSDDDSKAATQKLKAKTAEIYKITKDLDQSLGHSVAVPDQDPALPYISQLLREDIERAYQGLQSGQTEYAKGILRSSISYCIACHTRSPSGAQFPLLKAFQEPLKKASWAERISFQAASRQFDTAYSEVMSELKKPQLVGVTPLELEKATRIALAIAVRVKKDPETALLLTQAISSSVSATSSMKEDARSWAIDIRKWQEESKRTFASDIELILAARQLVGQAQESDTPVWAPHAEVRFLRASVLMHEMMSQYPKSKFIGEALYLTGLSYDVLRDLGLWSLHEMYFQACINHSPHSTLAQKCYKRYEESLTLGYTGSSGTHMPAAVRRHLEKFEKLAEIKPNGSKK